MIIFDFNKLSTFLTHLLLPTEKVLQQDVKITYVQSKGLWGRRVMFKVKAIFREFYRDQKSLLDISMEPFS